jgi:hypothetical protein
MRQYTSSFWCELRALVAVGWLQVVPTTCNQPTDRRVTPETCRGLRDNKVFVIVKVYKVGYVIVIHNDTRSTKYQIYTEQLMQYW